MHMHLVDDMQERKKRNSVPSQNGGQRDKREECECDQPPPETARDVPAMLNSLHPSRFPVGTGAAWRRASSAQPCEAAGMRISTSKSKAMVLNRKKEECLLRVKEEILPQVEEFKYLGVLFTSEGKMEQEIDRWIGVASARDLSQKAKLSIYRLIFIATLTYGHELWVMTERTRSRVQAAEMSFLRRVAGLSLRDRVRSSAIWEELGVEPLLLRIERSQMRWLGHLVRMPPGRLPGEVFRACPSGRRPPGRPRTCWRDCVSRLVWERLGIPPDELEEVAGEREVWASLLRLLPPRPNPG
ncbi:hypothetical protein D4764_17G0006260 [Takifugu flavidus]|uniref:Reverse transcriptase domain-containing protein n=1 Tax=Takifugu flavidus TaxID=433684 RepID=A0A5C6NV14_9TELE|nr:hypothetical protein D4764_17G0006260 [Takifugu flavidus]